MNVNIFAFSTLVGAAAAMNALGDPALRLKVIGSAGPFAAGETVTIALTMDQLGANEAAGFQAFLEFDAQILAFNEGHYTAVPFGVPIISPIVADGNRIDLASGINIFGGQNPTTADSTLAFLQFEVLQHTCLISHLEFRPHDPPSRITDAHGDDIVPLELIALPDSTCPADIVVSGTVNVLDLLEVINAWGVCAPSGDCCADINDDNVVSVLDLLAVINSWGACP